MINIERFIHFNRKGGKTMSTISDFYAKVMADEAVKKQITDILGGTPIENADDEELKKIGEVAKGMGFSISVEEAKEYFSGNEEELSDEFLEAVAGGVSDPDKPGVVDIEPVCSQIHGFGHENPITNGPIIPQ